MVMRVNEDEDEYEYISCHKLHFTFELYMSALAIYFSYKYQFEMNSKFVKKENLTNDK